MICSHELLRLGDRQINISLNVHANLKLLGSEVENVSSKIACCVDEVKVVPRHTDGFRIRKRLEFNQYPKFLCCDKLALVLNRFDKFFARFSLASSTE